MKKNKKAVALVVVMWIVLVTSLLSLTLMQIIIPFSKSVSGMENSAKAYYMANAWLEEWMLDLKKEREEEYDSSKNSKFKVNENKTFDLTKNLKVVQWLNSEMHYTKRTVNHKWKNEPESWKWDSEFDRDFNQISVWNPIQMDITWLELNKLKITFKVPKINGIAYEIPDDNLGVSTSEKCLISWQISSEIWFANSSEDTCIKRVFLNREFNMISRIGDTYFKSDKLIGLTQNERFNKICPNWTKCTLKFSIANELIWEFSNNEINLPYLEWKINYNWNKNYKLRYANIKSTWKSSIYTRDLEIKVPQQTTNEAFDFTVFQ